MSRALDSETVASLQNEDPRAIYEDIVGALCPPTAKVLEIEFLGKSHPLPAGTNVLVEGNSIAIPKLKLVQAFVVARRIFFGLVRNCPEEKHQGLRAATAIILLMDPEHLTAANTRKRLVQLHKSAPGPKLRHILDNEVAFVDSYLTSRLHRHTKSPTLWNHRRWLLELSRSVQIEHDVQKNLKTVVLTAAERHPRNYYAWSHLRWLVQAYGLGEESKLDMLDTVKDWCLRHPDDTSGFSFLLFGLSTFSPGEKLLRIERSTSICKEVLGLAVSFRWVHESVWVFLRTLVASGYVADDQKQAFFESINTLLATVPDCPGTQSILNRARDWCERYNRGEPHQ